MLYLGADPGLTGAIAAVNDDGRVELAESLPVMRDGKLAWIDATELDRLVRALGNARIAGVWIERAQATPQMGVSSAFNYGVGFGSLIAVMQLRDWRIEFVTPAAWKRAFGLGSDKRASLDKARMLFPFVRLDRAKDHGLAEALLIAEYGRRTHVRTAQQRLFA
jgi:hypothetical protein